jgi:hypothetical protein
MHSLTTFFGTLALLAAGTFGSPGLPDRFEPQSAQDATPALNSFSTHASRWPRIYIRDAYVRDAVVRSLDGAAEWLEGARCQSLLSDFADDHGRPLKERLAALNVPLPGYLGMLVFEDGETRAQCDPPGILAFTGAGSRVIRVCGRAFVRASQRDPSEGRATIIHEALHSLGLGENPPNPRSITYRVKQLCW